MRLERPFPQRVVVCKMPAWRSRHGQRSEKSRSWPKLSCCWQDRQAGSPPSKSLRRNVLGPKLSGCLQDRPVVRHDPGAVVVAGSARPIRGACSCTAASSRDVPPATSGSSCDNLRGSRGRAPDSCCASRLDAGADSLAQYRQPGVAGTSRVQMTAGNSGNGVRPFRRCRINAIGRGIWRMPLGSHRHGSFFASQPGSFLASAEDLGQ